MNNKPQKPDSLWITRLDVLGALLFAGLFLAGISIVIIRQNLAGHDLEIIRAAADSSTYKINLNTATHSELMLLPGIGNTRAAHLIAARAQNGPFQTMQQAREAAGMSPAKWREVEAAATLGENDKEGR